MKVIKCDPATPEAVAILEQSWAFLDARFPPEERFRLDLENLRAANVSFFLCTEAGMAVGCAAFAQQAQDWGELKSMFVSAAARGSHAARSLLSAVEDAAQAAGCSVLRLETGVGLDAAHRFYEREGFQRIGPFGTYPDIASSIFMQKNLAPDLLGDHP